MVASTAGDWLKHETGDERDRWSQLEKSETIRFSNGSKSQPTPGWKDTRTRRGYLGSLARTGTIYGRLQGWEVKNGRDKADTWEVQEANWMSGEMPQLLLLPSLKSLPLPPPPSPHWQKPLQANWDSSLEKKAYVMLREGPGTRNEAMERLAQASTRRVKL